MVVQWCNWFMENVTILICLFFHPVQLISLTDFVSPVSLQITRPANLKMEFKRPSVKSLKV